jgi:hypothetical protein
VLHCTVPVLFESSDHHAVLQDPVNKDWVALLESLDEKRFGIVERRYYLALSHFRRQHVRSPLPGQLEIVAAGKQRAQQEMLAVWEQRKQAASRPRESGWMSWPTRRRRASMTCPKRCAISPSLRRR